MPSSDNSPYFCLHRALLLQSLQLCSWCIFSWHQPCLEPQPWTLAGSLAAFDITGAASPLWLFGWWKKNQNPSKIKTGAFAGAHACFFPFGCDLQSLGAGSLYPQPGFNMKLQVRVYPLPAPELWSVVTASCQPQCRTPGNGLCSRAWGITSAERGRETGVVAGETIRVPSTDRPLSHCV